MVTILMHGLLFAQDQVQNVQKVQRHKMRAGMSIVSVTLGWLTGSYYSKYFSRTSISITCELVRDVGLDLLDQNPHPQVIYVFCYAGSYTTWYTWRIQCCLHLFIQFSKYEHPQIQQGLKCNHLHHQL